MGADARVEYDVKIDSGEQDGASKANFKHLAANNAEKYCYFKYKQHLLPVRLGPSLPCWAHDCHYYCRLHDFCVARAGRAARLASTNFSWGLGLLLTAVCPSDFAAACSLALPISKVDCPSLLGCSALTQSISQSSTVA